MLTHCDVGGLGNKLELFCEVLCSGQNIKGQGAEWAVEPLGHEVLVQLLGVLLGAPVLEEVVQELGGRRKDLASAFRDSLAVSAASRGQKKERKNIRSMTLLPKISAEYYCQNAKLNLLKRTALKRTMLKQMVL